MMWVIPIALMLAVAFHQRWRVHRLGQTAWKGGGFGMFSDIPRVFILTDLVALNLDGTVKTLRVVDQGSAILRTLLATPTQQNMINWAKEVSFGDWQPCGEFAHRRHPTSAVPSLVVTCVQVRRLAADFDGVSGTYAVRVATEYRHELEREREWKN